MLIDTPWLMFGWHRRVMEMRPGRAFFLIVRPRRDLTPEGSLLAGWPHIYGWIDWVDFSVAWLWGAPDVPAPRKRPTWGELFERFPELRRIDAIAMETGTTTAHNLGSRRK